MPLFPRPGTAGSSCCSCIDLSRVFNIQSFFVIHLSTYSSIWPLSIVCVFVHVCIMSTGLFVQFVCCDIHTHISPGCSGEAKAIACLQVLPWEHQLSFSESTLQMIMLIVIALAIMIRVRGMLVTNGTNNNGCTSVDVCCALVTVAELC